MAIEWKYPTYRRPIKSTYGCFPSGRISISFFLLSSINPKETPLEMAFISVYTEAATRHSKSTWWGSRRAELTYTQCFFPLESEPFGHDHGPCGHEGCPIYDCVPGLQQLSIAGISMTVCKCILLTSSSNISPKSRFPNVNASSGGVSNTSLSRSRLRFFLRGEI